MWMREPVEPASIMSAYCTSGEDGLCGVSQKTVLLGSGSDSYDDGRGGWGSVGVVSDSLISGLCGSTMGREVGRSWSVSSFGGVFHTVRISIHSYPQRPGLEGGSPGVLRGHTLSFEGLKSQRTPTEMVRQRIIFLQAILRIPKRLGPRPPSSLS